MPPRRAITGEIEQGERPDWGPLLLIAPELVDSFMWMFEVTCEGGVRLQAYKHIVTRRYLHLTSSGAAYADVGGARYRPAEPADLLEEALTPWWEGLGATPADAAACQEVIDRARAGSPRTL
jgi:hypothetical protein